MKKRIIAGAICLLLLLAVLIYAFSGPSDAVYITTARVKTQSLASDIDYGGTLEAEQNVPVTSDIGGRVVSVNAVLGQRVEKDQVLFAVDSADIALQYNQAEANYKAAAASYERVAGGSAKEAELQLRQTVERAENELRDATTAYQLAKEQYDNNTTIASAQAAYDMAKADYDRISLLVSLGEETQYSLDTAKSKMDSAKAQLETAKASARTALNSADSRLKNARLALSSAQEDYKLTTGTINLENIKSAAAQADAAKAALDIAKRKLDNASVKAPASGLIAMSDVSAGDMISPQTPVMTIVSAGTMEVTIHVTENGLSQVSAGMPAQVTASGTGETFDANVTAVAPATDAKTGLADVKLSIENAEDRLKAGMHVNVKLTASDENRKVYVPFRAVLEPDGNPYVFVIENNKLKKAPVALGEKRYAYVEVTGGLSPDAQVVVEGNTQVTENGKFHIVKAVS